MVLSISNIDNIAFKAYPRIIMPSSVLAGRVLNPLHCEYAFIETSRTNYLNSMLLADLKLVCSVLDFKGWIEHESEAQFAARCAYITLGWVEETQAYIVTRIVIHDASGAALVVVQPAEDEFNCIKTQRGYGKGFKTIDAVHGDILRILQPERGEYEQCSIVIKNQCSVLSREKSDHKQSDLKTST